MSSQEEFIPPSTEEEEDELEAQKAQEVEREEKWPEYQEPPRHMGLVTVEYECRKCGMSVEVAFPDEKSVPNTTKMRCPWTDCRGRLQILYDERKE